MGNIQRKVEARLAARKASAPKPNGKGERFRLPGSRKKKGK